MILDDLRNAIDAAVQADGQAVTLIQLLKAQNAQLIKDNQTLKDQLANSNVDQQATIDAFVARLTASVSDLSSVLK